MKRKSLLGFVVLVLFSVLTGAQAWCQFTQGPPGNPSAAGIISGMSAPSIPVAPSPVVPPAPSRGAIGLVPMGVPDAGFAGTGSLALYLGLSQEQVNKALELRSRFYAETRELRYAFLQKQLEMRKLFTDPNTDEATLLRKEKELSPIRQQLQEKVAQTIIEGRKILTRAQVEKLDQLPMGDGGMGVGLVLGITGNALSIGGAQY